LSPFSWQINSTHDLLIQIKKKLELLNFNIKILKNNNNDVTLQDFKNIKNGNYGICIISTHGTEIGYLSTGIEMTTNEQATNIWNEIDSDLEDSRDNYYIGTGGINNRRFLGLEPNFWRDANLQNTLLIIDSCSTLNPDKEVNPLIQILEDINIGGVLGFKDNVKNDGLIFIMFIVY